MCVCVCICTSGPGDGPRTPELEKVRAACLFCSRRIRGSLSAPPSRYGALLPPPKNHKPLSKIARSSMCPARLCSERTYNYITSSARG